MNKKILFLPLLLLGVLVILNWGCEKEKDDVCESFDALEEMYPNCDIPSICCPLDGGDCYIVNPDGENYICDKTKASEDNPDGCNDAENAYINEKCATKMSAEERDGLKKELRKFRHDLMEKARIYSVCH
jgi:hypothetical protein